LNIIRQKQGLKKRLWKSPKTDNFAIEQNPMEQGIDIMKSDMFGIGKKYEVRLDKFKSLKNIRS